MSDQYDPPKKSKVRAAGRPTKYSPEVVERLLSALADGMPIRGSCVVAGIGTATLGEWRAKFPELEARLIEARERARLIALQSIKAAGDRDWRAWAEWLRLSFPGDYRGSGNRIEVSATTSVIISEERRLQLIERRQRLLESQEKPPPPSP